MQKFVKKWVVYPVGVLALFALEHLSILAELSPLLISLPVLLPLYFLPSLVAIGRKKARTRAIIFFNLLTGWFGVCWIAMLAWALERPKTCELKRSI